MKLALRILGAVGMLVVVAIAGLAFAVSYDAACPLPQPPPDAGQHTQAVLYRCYGAPEVLQLEAVAKPVPADDQILVKVHSASLNPLDWHYMRGEPYFMRLGAGLGAPKDTSMGVDFSGTVAAVGKHVTQFKPGDAVFGARGGALGEYVTVRENGAVALKPDNVTFDQAAAIPIAGLTALQALRDKGKVRAGQKILINGASGGVGTFAVQIAKALGAEVTGVCSGRNVELVRSLGADHVIDYTQEDFTQADRQYDLILDNVGNHSLLAYRRVLKPAGILVMVGGRSTDPWLGPMMQPLKAALLSPFISQDSFMFLSDMNQTDLQHVAGLMQEGKVVAVIDRTYPLREIVPAMTYLERGHARGKVIVNVEQ